MQGPRELPGTAAQRIWLVAEFGKREGMICKHSRYLAHPIKLDLARTFERFKVDVCRVSETRMQDPTSALEI